ncbi:hypothetical protein PGH07_10945 [Sulfurovum sp. zt1-1]|uniref:Uncharacterized protein n=1 Tax=Sulfurovum zhangzhouensis TaxID=3019067 RepID=A0ABT7R0R9_9BACT|nr:hypothetical protein [Sulfurovum zhangzhouensis]MDM5272689.1 hypothetical protein [Sulfurovum zhangzhouensis]
MGAGITIVFWIIILVFLSSVIAIMIKKDSYSKTFLRVFTSLIVFIFIFVGINQLGSQLIGKRSGGFFDSGYCEVQNGYTIEWIDSFDDAVLKDGEKILATNVKSFSEKFVFALQDNLLFIRKSNEPKNLIIDTQTKTSIPFDDFETKTKTLIFKTPKEYLEEQSKKPAKILLFFGAFIIAILCAVVFFKKYS